MSTQFNSQKRFYFILVKQFLYKQFSLVYVCSFVLFGPLIGPYQVLLLRAREDLGAIIMTGYSAFPKARASLELHY